MNATAVSTADLELKQVSKTFDTAAGPLTILKDVDLSLVRGGALAITGPSGSGKSTLLYLVGLLDRPSGGEIRLLGENPWLGSAGEQARFRNRNIGFVFQDHYLLPQCTVLENVLIPTLAGNQGGPELTRRAETLLDRVGLGARKTHRPDQLSGGERQRTALCRALINSPPLLLADEPTGNLDRATAETVGTLLLDLAREQQTILLCVTHSPELAARFPQHHELRDGRLVDARA